MFWVWCLIFGLIFHQNLTPFTNIYRPAAIHATHYIKETIVQTTSGDAGVDANVDADAPATELVVYAVTDAKHTHSVQKLPHETKVPDEDVLGQCLACPIRQFGSETHKTPPNVPPNSIDDILTEAHGQSAGTSRTAHPIPAGVQCESCTETVARVTVHTRAAMETAAHVSPSVTGSVEKKQLTIILPVVFMVGFAIQYVVICAWQAMFPRLLTPTRSATQGEDCQVCPGND